MEIEPDLCHRALATRDPRFDGLFFVGVTSTRIYCRPICPARTPGRDRCRFFAVAAAAERAGFRPCLRCRPELAPGAASVDAVGRTARLAASRIGAGAMDGEGGLEALAADLGVGSRHLRRVLRRELGVTPVELAQTHRLLLAKRLLTETAMPIIDVAFASGFASVRRFNALFLARYRLAPRDLRRTRGKAVADGGVRLTLAYRPPLAWDAMLRFLGDRAVAGVEAVAGGAYLRTVAIGEARGWLKVEPHPDPGRHALRVELPTSLTPALPRVLGRLRDLFDLDARPDLIDEHLDRDERLRGAPPGLRVPGAFDGFELAARAVLGQQVSVRAARTLAGRFATAFGEPIETPFPGLDRLAPTPARVAVAELGELTALGLVASRAECVRALARAACDGLVSLQPGTDPVASMEGLTAVPGVGPWTASYVAMRALRWPDAFPHADLVLRKALGGMPPREALETAEAWRPWRAYAAMRLWHGSGMTIEPGGPR